MVGYKAAVDSTMERLGTSLADWNWTGGSYETRDSFGSPVGVCDLCDEHGLANKFTLASAKSALPLDVGSSCVERFVQLEAGYGPTSRWAFRRQVRAAIERVATIGLLMKTGNLTYIDAKAIRDRIELRIERFDVYVDTGRREPSWVGQSEAQWRPVRERQGRKKLMALVTVQTSWGAREAWRKVVPSDEKVMGSYGEITVAELIRQRVALNRGRGD